VLSTSLSVHMYGHHVDTVCAALHVDVCVNCLLVCRSVRVFVVCVVCCIVCVCLFVVLRVLCACFCCVCCVSAV
jgi:hypothetical protein